MLFFCYLCSGYFIDMRMAKNFFRLLLLLLSGVDLYAADVPQFKTPSVRLPNSEIKAIFRSSDGFLWLGTGIGLVRYDGYEAVSFPAPVTELTKSPNTYVDYITEYPKGTLWVRMSSGMSVFDLQREQYVQPQGEYLSGMGIHSVPWYVFADSHQRLWVAYHGGYLACRDSTGHMTDITPTLQGSGIGREVTTIREYPEGIIIVYNDGNMVCMDAATTRQRWHTVIDQPVQGEILLYADSKGLIWLYSYKWIKYYNPKEQTWGHRIDFDSKNYNGVHAISQDPKGHIWVGRERALEIYDGNDELMYRLLHSDHDERSIPYNTITALLNDNNGAMWVGCQRNGIAYYHESIYKSDFLSVDDVTTILSAPDGQIWLGTNSSGMVRWNPRTDEKQLFGTASGLPSNTVVSLLQARDGRLWIGTYLGGLSCYDGRTFRNYGVTQNGQGLANANVWALAEDQEGNIWIGTLGGGLQVLNPQTGVFTTYNEKNTSLPIDVIASLCSARDGSIYVATMTTGIYVKRKGESLKPFGKLGKMDQFIYQIHEDSKSRLWVATHSGLFCYDPQTDSISTIPLISHTPTPLVYGVAEDAEGNIWTMTDCEVFRIDHDGNQQVFNENDGLKIGSFNSNAIHITPDGNVLTGSLFGVNIIRPTNVIRNTVPPHVLFTRLDIQGRRVQVGEEVDGCNILEQSLNSQRSLTLSHDQAAFTVYFASDDMLLPAKTRFRYRLEGIDHDYYECAPDVHWATYTSLPSGHYTLHVVAVGSDGTEGEEAILNIRILPPWWLSVWAWIAYTLVVIGVLAAAYFFIKRREQHKFQIQQLEDDARKTEELNQMKFRFFTNISHELRTPLTLILSPLENVIRETDDERQKSQLAVVQKNANRLLMLVNQLLDFRKMEMSTSMKLNLSQGNVVDFIKSICDSFTSLTDKQGVQLTFFSAVPSLEMAFDEDKLSKIMFNLLSNAFKFTPDNGRVDVAIECSKNNPEQLTIRIADTGIGISDADKLRIFDRFYQVTNTADTRHAAGSGIGLSLVKDFVEMHDGTISVVDNIGSGSVFVIQLPIRQIEVPSVGQVPVEQPESKHSEESANRQTVLVVDDNEEMVSFMRDTFSLYFNVKTATNGQQAWDIIQATPPDIIVSDMMMPVMDGNELCRLVKSDAATRNIPFVMLTARHADESRVESLKLGADDYVTKPFNTEVLLLRIRKLLELVHRQRRGQIDPEVEDIEITPVDEKLVADAIKYVEQNMSNDELSVEELSRALAMSRTNLYKKLLAITGKKPIEFIRVIRLKRAAQYLRDSGLSISEVAYRVGFNPRVFSRHFKDEFGCLPSEYQEKENG